MGNWRSGRRAIPLAVHVQRGTLDSHAANRRMGEPRYSRGAPPVPEALGNDPLALAHWVRLVEILSGPGVLTSASGSALQLLVQALADLDRVRAQMATVGFKSIFVEPVHDAKGKQTGTRVRENPLVRRSERLTEQCARLLEHFGLTPATASKVHLTHDQAPQPTRISRYITPKAPRAVAR